MRDHSQLQAKRLGRPAKGLISLMLAYGLLVSSPALAIFVAPAQTPAIQSEQALSATMIAVTRAGERLVAVGAGGVILYSSDQGQSWHQAQVPVSVDLVAVHFPTAQKGWAVGHGGVVLHSTDAGQSWQQQLDGRQALKLGTEFYRSHLDTLEQAQAYLDKELRIAEEDGTQPFLDVFFTDESTGYVVGTFNRIYRTDDGGASWQPLMHASGNDQEWHFYAVEGAGNDLFLAGEQGRVWRLDRAGNRFVSIDTPYNGTLFGLLPSHSGLFAYGMRGNLFRSQDQGQQWQHIELPVKANLIGAFELGDGSLLLISQGGDVLRSRDGGASFELSASQPGLPYFAALPVGAEKLAVAGFLGMRVASF